MGISITGGVSLPGQLSFYIPPPPPAGKTLWSWGYNGGLLGQGDTIRRSSPVQVGSLETWASIAVGGNHTNAITTTGELWAWGNNAQGYLGDGTVIKRSSPVQIGNLTDWASVSGGAFHSLAIKTDGSLWSWGGTISQEREGQKGHGNTSNLSSPVQVGSLIDWAKVAAGEKHSLAIKTDGTLWAWGENSVNASIPGGLGLGDQIDRSSPVQVGSLTDWSKIAGGKFNSLAIKTNGTLWSWGYNSSNTSGVIGDGTVLDRNSPVQIGALSDWIEIACGERSSFALRTDSSLWSWGSGADGRLGHGNTTNHSSPVQVGALTDWTSVFSQHTGPRVFVIKTDGTLWAWGSNPQGQLGLGDTTKRSSPVQVGSLTDWSSIDLGGNHTVALKTI